MLELGLIQCAKGEFNTWGFAIYSFVVLSFAGVAVYFKLKQDSEKGSSDSDKPAPSTLL